MINTHNHKHLRWVDLSTPSTEEVRRIMIEYNVSPHIGEELLAPSLKPKVDLYQNCIYLILHFPAIHHTHGKQTNQEIDFVIGRDFIITTHYDSIDPLHKFSKVFEVHSILNREDLGEHAGFIFYYMIKKLYKSLNHELDYLNDRLKIIETSIFSGQEKLMVFELSKISRELLQFKQALALHDEVLTSFETAAKKFFGQEFEYNLKAMFGAYSRVEAAIAANTDTLNELRATNDSLLSTKQNEIIKVLAIVSFLILPLTLISGLFGMNIENAPFVNGPDAFYKIILLMIVVAIATFAFFKYKKWL